MEPTYVLADITDRPLGNGDSGFARPLRPSIRLLDCDKRGWHLKTASGHARVSFRIKTPKPRSDPRCQMKSATRWMRMAACRLLHISAWHSSTSDRQPYRQAIIDRLNKAGHDSVLEIGCGFADIITALDARTLRAADCSRNVLIGARLFHLRDWITGRVRFAQMHLGDSIERKFSAVICVNFIHGIEPSRLREIFHQLFAEVIEPDGVLVFDTVTSQKHRYKHDPAFLLSGLPVEPSVIGGFPYGRSIVFATAARRRDGDGSGAFCPPTDPTIWPGRISPRQ